MPLLSRKASLISQAEDKYLALQVLGCTNGDAHCPCGLHQIWLLSSPHQLSEYARGGLTVPILVRLGQ